MTPRTERNRRRDQTARLPGRWRRLGARQDSRPERPADPDQLPRAVWATADDGRAAMYWAAGESVDIDVSDLAPPATARVHTAPIDEAALADLLQRSRVA